MSTARLSPAPAASAGAARTRTTIAADRDYDAPRTPTLPGTDSLELLQERRAARADDLADTDFPDGYQIPGGDLLEEDELDVPVVPVQSDEFRCGGCFLVLHRRLGASQRGTEELCRDCA